MADGKIIIDTKIDTSGAEKGTKKLDDIVKGGLGGLGKGVLAAGAALGTLGGYAIKVGSDFEEGMSKVKAVSGASGEEMVLLSNKAKEMGATTKFSATESAEAMLYMGMAGWKSQQMVDGLPGIMNLAAASGESLGLVSDIVTDSLTAFGLSAKDSAGFADLLASASSNSNTNVSMLGESFKYVAPVAGALGHSAQDTAFALGLMANAGIKGSQSGTALRASLTNLAKPTKAMSKEMDALGISLVDTNGEVKAGKVLYDELREKFAPLTDAQKASTAATLFGKEAMSGMLSIINASDEDYNNLYDNLTNSAGAAEEMANIMNDNLKGQVVLLGSALEGLGIQIYESVDNPLKDVVKSANDMVESLSTAFKEGGFAALTESIGAILAQIIVSIAEYAPKIIDSTLVVIQAFVTGIQNNLPQIITSAIEIIDTLVKGIIEMLPQILQMGIDIIIQLALGLANKMPELIPLAVDCVLTLVDTILDNIDAIIDAGIALIIALAEGLINALPRLIEKVPIIIEKLLTALMNNWPKLLKAGVDLVIMIAEGLIHAIPQLLSKIPILIKAMLNAIGQFFRDFYKTGSIVVQKIGDGLLSMLGFAISNCGTLTKTILDSIGAGIVGVFGIGVNIVKGVWEGITSLAGWLGSKVKGFFTGIVDGAKSALGIHSPSRVLRDEVGAMIPAGVAVGIEENLDLVEDATDKMVEALTPDFSSLIPNTTKLIKDLGDKIVDINKDIAEDIGKVKQKIADEELVILNKSKKDVAEIQEKTSDNVKKEELKTKEKVFEIRQRAVEKNRELTAKEVRDIEKIERDSSMKVFDLRMQEAYKLEDLKAKETEKIKSIHEKGNKELAKIDSKVAKERLTTVENFISDKKKLEKLSVFDEMKLWETAVDSFVEGTEERRVAELKLRDTKVAIYKDLKTVNDDYTKKVQESNKKMIDGIDELNKKYQSAVDNRTKSLYSFAGIFDEVKKKEEVSGQKLMANLKSQTNTFKDWTNNIQALGDRGLDTSLMDELKAMGPSAADNIAALNTLTDAELKQYTELWQEKSILARTQAEKELIGMKDDTSKQIEGLKLETNKQLDKLKEDWITKIVQVRTGTTDEFNAMNADMPEIGENLIEGMQKGLSNMEPSLMAQAHSIADRLKRIMSSALDIPYAQKGISNKIEDALGNNTSSVVAKMSATVDSNVTSATAGVTARSNHSNNPSPVTNNNDNGITQNVTIVSPENTPSENARALKKAGRDLAFGY